MSRWQHRMRVVMSIACGAMLLAGEWVVVVAQPLAREITFAGTGEVQLSGTLLLPSVPRGRFSAAVLVQGSGPTDRDGNQPPALTIDLLKQVAEHLAAQGIATLRFDKRGQYRSGAAPKDETALIDFVAWDNYIADVVAAMHILQQQPEIDPARVALIGHSEGGLLVMHACTWLQRNPGGPAAIVLLATPGRRSDLVLHDQLERILTAQGAAPAQKRFFLDKNATISTTIRQTGVVPADIPPGLRAFYPAYLGKFWQGQLKNTPTELAAMLDRPTLVIHGDRDQQVTPDDAAALATAVNRGKNGEALAKLVMIRGASHNLKATTDMVNPGLNGPVVPEALKAITDWLTSAPPRP